MERPVDVEGGPGRPLVLGHQLQVGEGGDEGEQEGEQERGPDGAAHVGGHVAGERVDAGAEDVAQDEEGQHRPGDHPVEPCLLGVLDAGDMTLATGGLTLVRLAVDAVGQADHLLRAGVVSRHGGVEPRTPVTARLAGQRIVRPGSRRTLAIGTTYPRRSRADADDRIPRQADPKLGRRHAEDFCPPPRRRVVRVATRTGRPGTRQGVWSDPESNPGPRPPIPQGPGLDLGAASAAWPLATRRGRQGSWRRRQAGRGGRG